MREKQKFGVIDVGGGFRGIYAAGIFDYCLDAGQMSYIRNIRFGGNVNLFTQRSHI